MTRRRWLSAQRLIRTIPNCFDNDGPRAPAYRRSFTARVATTTVLPTNRFVDLSTSVIGEPTSRDSGPEVQKLSTVDCTIWDD
jgi:hypothetical protein